MGNPIEFRELLVKMHTERMTSRWGAYSYNHKKPIWNARFERGKTILITGEAGIGDELFGAKFAHNFVERGMKVVFATNYWSSYNVIARIESIDKVIHITEVSEFEDYDYWVPVGEVPVALNLTQDQVPIQPYLEPTEEYLTKWKRIIPPSDKFKIGVRWTGDPHIERNGGIIPAQYFEKLGSLPNVELYSLHKEHGIDDIPSNVIPLHEHGRSWFDTWDDTFAAISQLDLTISSSTNIPIVCVGLNKPIWTVVPIGPSNPYYLWLQDFWFGDKMKIYTQSVQGNWNQPFEDVKNDLLKIL
jgi:hypothetical protein